MFVPTDTPGIVLSTMKADILLLTGRDVSLFVIANTMNLSAKPEFVVKIDVPLRMYVPSSCLTACFWQPAASEPALGSVKAKQPISLPSISGLRYFCFCSSVPCSLIHEQQSDVCTESVIPVEASTFDNSSIARAYVSTSAPAPPYSLAYGIPKIWHFCIFSTSSAEKTSVSSMSLAMSLISFSAKLWNNSFASSCVLVNLKLTI